MGASSAAQLTAGNVCHVEYVINDTDAAGQASRHGAKGRRAMQHARVRSAQRGMPALFPLPKGRKGVRANGLET